MSIRTTRTEHIDSMQSNREQSSVVVQIVEAIAEIREVEIDSLEPLARYLDPAAMERLIDTTTVRTSVSLELYGCTVEIDGDGNVDARRSHRPED